MYLYLHDVFEIILFNFIAIHFFVILLYVRARIESRSISYVYIILYSVTVCFSIHCVFLKQVQQIVEAIKEHIVPVKIE